jgi:hypothetical protein
VTAGQWTVGEDANTGVRWPPSISGRTSLSNRAKRRRVFHNFDNFIFAFRAFKGAFVIVGFVRLDPSNPHLIATGRALWTNYNPAPCYMGAHADPPWENWISNLAATLRMELLASLLSFGAIGCSSGLQCVGHFLHSRVGVWACPLAFVAEAQDPADGAGNLGTG